MGLFHDRYPDLRRIGAGMMDFIMSFYGVGFGGVVAAGVKIAGVAGEVAA